MKKSHDEKMGNENLFLFRAFPTDQLKKNKYEKNNIINCFYFCFHSGM